MKTLSRTFTLVRRRGSIALGAALLVLAAGSAQAYKTTTHAIISSSAGLRSVVYQEVGPTGLLATLGYGRASSERFPLAAADSFGRGDLTATAAELLAIGAVDEDNEFPDTRFLNHFFNPQTGTGLDQGHRSPDWALEDLGDVVTLGLRLEQRFSYRSAQQALYDSLVLPTDGERRLAFGRSVKTLGHVIHHLQDMAQPQHARNDPHTPFPFVNPREAELYESYTEDVINPILVEQILAPNAQPIAFFNNVRQFWTESGSTAVRGMADFSSKQYVTFGTGYLAGPGGLGPVVRPAPGLPLPNERNACNQFTKRIERRFMPVPRPDGTTRSIPMEFVVGDICDPLTDAVDPGTPPVIFKDKLLASMSLTDRKLRARDPTKQTFSVNEFVFKDNYAILLPRAQAFSSGLINHMFQGRLALRRSGTNAWSITPNYAMTGELIFLTEDQSGRRTPVASFQIALPGGAAREYSVATPASLNGGRMVAAFRGQIGNEVPRDPGFRAVAGAVAKIAEPDRRTCRQNFKLHGGFPGAGEVFDVGNVAGNIQLKFEAFQIPDRLIVETNQTPRRILFDTFSLVSSLLTRTISFDPAQLGGADSLIIRVIAPDEATAWDVAASCPGTSLNGADFPPTRIVSFRFGGTLTDARGRCLADAYIDNKLVAQLAVSPSSGTAQIAVPLTVGTGHGIEYRNFSCTPDAANLSLNVSFTDPRNGSQIPLAPLSTRGVRLFDIF